VVKVDDALDVMAVHGVGGATGTILTAIFGAAALGGLGLSATGVGAQLGIQIVGVLATLVWSVVLTFVIVKVTTLLVGLRIDPDSEIEGLDLIAHGEKGKRATTSDGAALASPRARSYDRPGPHAGAATEGGRGTGRLEGIDASGERKDVRAGRKAAALCIHAGRADTDNGTTANSVDGIRVGYSCCIRRVNYV
jgi:hypothetical protein